MISLLCQTAALAHHELQQPLPLPMSVNDGETIELLCGQIYSGTLDLRGRSGVTLRSGGDCGKASLTPAQPVRGWIREGRVWSAALDFAPLMLQVGDLFIAQAHHPNGANEWLTGQGQGADRLQVEIAHELTGATLVWRPEDWLILSQRVSSDERGLLRLANPPDAGFGFREQTPYYLEGQRWMLDSPGEWVYEKGRLYLWPPDGRSPEGRVWAAPRATAIDARGARDLRISNLKIFLAARGIDGAETYSLAIDDTDIINSFDEAIRIGGEGARVSGVRVTGTRQHGLRAEDDAHDVRISDSVFEAVGMLGMPLRSKGAIVFEQASHQRIERNQIDNVAYIGIRVYRNALVSGNVVSRACQRMTDCGGIYTFARDRKPLNTLIERNRISGLRGRLSHAIYLDDFANGVIVRANQLADNPGGMQLHDAFGNLIVGNVFSRSTHEHILFNETAPYASIGANQVSGNRFISTSDVPFYRLWSHHGASNLRRFALFGRNHYLGKPQGFAQLQEQGWISATDWRAQMQESGSVFSAAGTPAQLPRKPQKK